MKPPRLALAVMITFTVVVAGVGVALSSGLSKAFYANSSLNSVILAILVFGIDLVALAVPSEARKPWSASYSPRAFGARIWKSG